MVTISMTPEKVKEAVKHRNTQHTKQDPALPACLRPTSTPKPRARTLSHECNVSVPVEQPHKLASKARQGLQN